MGDKKNFLAETIEAIKGSGHKESDVMFIGSDDGEERISWDDFQKEANFNYNAGYGRECIKENLIVYFTDKTHLFRETYDGSEWWEYAKLLNYTRDGTYRYLQSFFSELSQEKEMKNRQKKEKGKLSIQLEKDYRKLINSFQKDWTYEKNGKVYLGAEGKDVRADALEYFFANDMAVILEQAKTEAKIEVLEEVVKSLDEEGSSGLRFGTNIVGFAQATAKVKNELSNLKKKKK